jgi:NADH:ubiquinone oxidoreductase subunit 6 (subunit J)
VTPQARIGLVTSILAFIGGVWLFMAPFIMRYQEVGEDWITATKNDLWAGGVLIAVSVLTLFLFATLALRDAAHADERRREEEEAQSSS